MHDYDYCTLVLLPLPLLSIDRSIYLLKKTSAWLTMELPLHYTAPVPRPPLSPPVPTAWPGMAYDWPETWRLPTAMSSEHCRHEPWTTAKL